MSLILEKFRSREAQKTVILSADAVAQANLIPEQKAEDPKNSDVILTADQVETDEAVLLDGVRAVCKGRQADGRIAFHKEGNSRNTLVEGNKEVVLVPAEVPQNIIIDQKPEPVTVTAPANVPAVTQTALSLPFEGFITPEMVKQLFAGNEALIQEAFEEDELPDAQIKWLEVAMKECMVANGKSEMMFAIKRGQNDFYFPFKQGNTFKGIIIYQHSAKACYDKDSKPGDKKPPLCWSENGKVPFGGKFFSRSCNGDGRNPKCPYNEFGTSLKGGKGKACADRLKCFVYIPELKDVFLFDVSPMSIKSVSAYLNNLAVNNPPIKYTMIMTNFTCKGVYDGSTPYGVIEQISPEPIVNIEDYKISVERRVQLKELMVPGIAPKFPEPEDAGTQVTSLN
jgi:hypothetical protein